MDEHCIFYYIFFGHLHLIDLQEIPNLLQLMNCT